MAKYVIEIPEDRIKDGKLYLMAEVESVVPTRIQTGIKTTPYTEPDEQEIIDKAHEEAWEFMGKIECMTCGEVHDVFGIDEDNSAWLCNQLSYSDAKARYDQWKAEHEQIRVGDEVGYFGVADNDGNVCYEGVVIEINNDTCRVLEKDGSTYELNKTLIRHKTNRHFPEVAELLEKMREE